MTIEEKSPCTVIESGSVGEIAESVMLTHQLSSEYSKMLVLRRKESSLCPNTGVIAIVVIDGEVVASGSINSEGSTLTHELQQNETAVVVVRTVPVFNDIVCIQLGELSFDLEECDLIG